MRLTDIFSASRLQKLSTASALALITAAGSSHALDKPYSQNASPDRQKRVLWGDTHLHTDLSLDARAYGVRLDTATAYRFARGEQVTATLGQPTRLTRPLDFLVVADHSDGMGVMTQVLDGDSPKYLKEPVIQDWRKRLSKGGKESYQAGMDIVTAFTQGKAPEVVYEREMLATAWAQQIKTADQFNEPGRFTAMIGYEWTSTPGGNNLHRNVLYRDDASYAGQLLPFTVRESKNPQDLWAWMEKYEKQTGGQVLALAHNGNMSNGMMFPELDPETGEAFSERYLKQRARWEPLYEVTQIKGDGEAHPFLSKNDEFADYETWDTGNMGPVVKQNSMLQHEYAREALKNGLKIQQQRGTNPYQFGMLGSTDSHTGLATADEDNFFGKMTYLEPKGDRWSSLLGGFDEVKVYGWEMVSSGYAAVWATENTREAIFDAMQRREVYATTGPRIVLKFDLIDAGTSKPMGSIVKAGTTAPTFSVSAMKDPIGANLDRVQIIKGWVDSKGISHEKIYEVSWSGKRKLSKQGKLPALPSTVNVKQASYTNTVGSKILEGTWQDPDFDATTPAFYYARVLEIPTPRWTAYDAAHFGVEIDKGIPMQGQERAYSSPIWLNP